MCVRAGVMVMVRVKVRVRVSVRAVMNLLLRSANVRARGHRAYGLVLIATLAIGHSMY